MDPRAIAEEKIPDPKRKTLRRLLDVGVERIRFVEGYTYRDQEVGRLRNALKLVLCEAKEWREYCTNQLDSFEGDERLMVQSCATIADARIKAAELLLKDYPTPTSDGH